MGSYTMGYFAHAGTLVLVFYFILFFGGGGASDE
jgi:hypothetical protein